MDLSATKTKIVVNLGAFVSLYASQLLDFKVICIA